MVSIQPPLPGKDGMVLLEYIGGNAGTTSWWGPVTQTRYEFGGTRPVGYVDQADVEGMLQMKAGRNRRVFQPYKQLPQRPVEAPVIVEPPAPLPKVILPAPEPIMRREEPDILIHEISIPIFKAIGFKFDAPVLEQLLADEQAGRNRKGMVAAIKEALS